jgi:hypothetical protein
MLVSRTGIDSSNRGARCFGLVAAAAVAMLAATAQAAPTAEQKCESGKNSVAGKYAACMHKAQQKFVSGGGVDLAGRTDAETSCASKLDGKWSSLESKAGVGVCPSEMDQTPVRDFIDACVVAVEGELAGGTLPLDVATCNADLDTCNDDLATCSGDLATCTTNVGVTQTGFTQCYNASAVIVPCAGSGQDAEYRHRQRFEADVGKALGRRLDPRLGYDLHLDQRVQHEDCDAELDEFCRVQRLAAAEHQGAPVDHPLRRRQSVNVPAAQQRLYARVHCIDVRL